MAVIAFAAPGLLFACAKGGSPGPDLSGGPDARPAGFIDARPMGQRPDAMPGEEADARIIRPIDGPPGSIDGPPRSVDGPPGSVDGPPIIDAPPPDAAPQAVSITITHSNDPTTVLDGNSTACIDTGTGFHQDNSYIRAFVLNDFDITSDFTVTSVTIGIETAQSGSGSQTIEVRFSTFTGALTFANMDRIGTFTVDLTDRDLARVQINLPDPGLRVPAGSQLAVEIFTPNGDDEGNAFIIGSNDSGQSDGSFLAAPDCGINEPTLASNPAIGFPDMDIVMSVTGTHIP